MTVPPRRSGALLATLVLAVECGDRSEDLHQALQRARLVAELTCVLGMLRSPRALPALLDALEQRDMIVAAAFALARIGDPRAAHAPSPTPQGIRP